MIKIENFENETAVLVKYVRTPPEELLGEKVDFGLLCLYKGFYYLFMLRNKEFSYLRSEYLLFYKFRKNNQNQNQNQNNQTKKNTLCLKKSKMEFRTI